MLKEYYQNVLSGPWKTAGTDTQYKVNYNVLYIAGSNSSEDWKNNFDFPAIPYKDQPVKWMAHRGFVKAWKEARKKIFEDVVFNGVDTIIGYSYGGAIATLAHEDLVFNFKDVKFTTFTFGSPRVVWGNPKIANRFENLHRIKINGDLVTNVPPSIFGYRHMGHQIRFSDFKFPWWKNHLPIEYKYNIRDL